MAEKYPSYWDLNEEYVNDGSDEYNKIVANLYYLMQHNLVEKKSITISNAQGTGFSLIVNLPTINQNGMDFLANDGGLSAILSTVTIRIDAEQFRQMLLTRVDESNLSPDQKNQITSALQELPSESIKHLSTKFVDAGWNNLGSLIQLIQNIPI